MLKIYYLVSNMIKMNLDEIGDTAANLKNMINAGVVMTTAIDRMTQLQPKYKDFWDAAHKGISQGKRLSDYMKEIWPASFISALVAGEESGDLAGVLDKIERTVEIQNQIKDIIGGIYYPLFMIIMGVVIFVSFMTFTIPTLSNALNNPGKKLNAIMELSMFFAKVAKSYGMEIGAFLIFIIGYSIIWLIYGDGKTKIFNFLIESPFFGKAFIDLYFGLWAYYISMMTSAGLTLDKSLELTNAVIPESLQRGINMMRLDLKANKSISEAAKGSSNEDPRNMWPFYIKNAFIIGAETGDLDKEMNRIAEPLIKEAIRNINKKIKIANVFATFIASAFIMSPWAAYMIQVFSSMTGVK
jgi:type II secretory pathway component PulF